MVHLYVTATFYEQQLVRSSLSRESQALAPIDLISWSGVGRPGPPVASARWLAEDPRQLRLQLQPEDESQAGLRSGDWRLIARHEDVLFLGTLWRQKCVGLHRLFFFLAVTS